MQKQGIAALIGAIFLDLDEADKFDSFWSVYVYTALKCCIMALNESLGFDAIVVL